MEGVHPGLPHKKDRSDWCFSLNPEKEDHQISSVRLLLFLSCGLLAGSQGFAENDTGGGDWHDGRGAWKSLEDFENETVEVQMYGGQLVSGRLADVTDTFVLVDRKGTLDRVDRDQVHRITSVQGSTRARNTLLGATIGVGSFGLFSYWFAGPGHGDIVWTPLGVVAVATVGAVGGGLIGLASSSPESRSIVYEPPPSSTQN